MEIPTMPSKQEIALRDKTHLLADVAFEPKADLSAYHLALDCAGVEVLDFAEFGSYQGRWIAKVRFPNGEEYFVSDYYGSCSGCDAFEAEFGWSDQDKPDYAHHLRDFGREFLTNCMTKEQAEAELGEHIYGADDQDMINWVRAH
jgi:hypothetical protein